MTKMNVSSPVSPLVDSAQAAAFPQPSGHGEAWLHSGFFVLRTPLLPVNVLKALGSGLTAQQRLESGASDPDLEAALSADRAAQRACLAALFAQPEVKEALLLASPLTADSMEVWQRDPDSERGRKIQNTLIRYAIRMVARPTPFGLFAGCSFGTIGAMALAPQGRPLHIELGTRATYQRKTRLDGDVLASLSAQLLASRELRTALCFYTNRTLYRGGGRWRYIERRTKTQAGADEATARMGRYLSAAIEPQPFLDAAIERARDGASFSEIAAALLAADPELDADQVTEFVHELIDNQILMPELEPAVTGPAPLLDLRAQLEAAAPGVPRAAHAAGEMAAIARELVELDHSGLGAVGARYEALAARLDREQAPVDRARMVQVDLLKPITQAKLRDTVLAEVMRAVNLVHRIGEHAPNAGLQRFREAFVMRYEAREVPLLEALDEELGVGFDGAGSDEPLLAGLAFSRRPELERQVLSKRYAALRNLLLRALRDGARQVELTEEVAAALAHPSPPPLPDAFAAIVNVLDCVTPERRSDFRLLYQGAVGPSGARLLGRFCHLDPQLADLVRQHLRAEERLRPDALFAEIVHLSDGRLNNILARPLLREHELAFHGRSGAPRPQQIDLEDLRVCVQGERIVLRSARHQREVLPRLTTAHAYGDLRHAGIYRFLAALQGQGTASSLAWSWGSLAGSPFLPRICSGRLILACARWQLSAAQIQHLGQARGAARFRAASTLRQELGLPRHVALIEGDNVLPIDLESSLELDSFVDLIKSRTEVLLEEVLPQRDSIAELTVTGPEGPFRHELIIPFIRRAPEAPISKPAAMTTPRSIAASAPVSTAYPPGSQWLFAKIYTGPATADQLLRELVPGIVSEARSHRLCDRWFFIRYADPAWHLRIRFRGEPAALVGQLLPLLSARLTPYLANGSVQKFQLDTYRPETERYGGPVGIDLAERLFEIDSDATLRLMPLVSGTAPSHDRWLLALGGAQALLDELLGRGQEGCAAQRRVLAQLLAGLDREFLVDTSLRRQIGEKYRRERTRLESFLSGLLPEADDEMGEALRARSRQMGPLAAEFKERAAAGTVLPPLENLAGSYIHMWMNRMHRFDARRIELISYHLMERRLRQYTMTSRAPEQTDLTRETGA
ncbi:MAG: lantibiotic dehydratase [Polyangia bacterium]